MAKGKDTIKGMSPFGMHDYQAQDDMHTLMRAHEIKKDPKRHAAAKSHAKKKLEQMKDIATGKTGGGAPAKKK